MKRSRGSDRLLPLTVAAVSRPRRRWSLKVMLWMMMVVVLFWCGAMPITVTVTAPPILHSWPTTHFSVRKDEDAVVNSPPVLRPERVYENNGYLMLYCNGGLNQMRAAICDMVTIARYLNLTLVLPELDRRSFWADVSNFEDIFDVDHFINSLRDEVKVIRKLPGELAGITPYSMEPVSWSRENYYLEKILPLVQKHGVMYFRKTDTRLANNGLPLQLQKLRCRVNYDALKFSPQVEVLGKKLISILKKKGKFVVLHLRYEMDMLSFSGCTHGCSDDEIEELTRMRYKTVWWKEKEIISEKKRLEGLCPLTPEETALTLKALGYEENTTIYIAAGHIYGGDARMAAFKSSFPNTVSSVCKLLRKLLIWSSTNRSIPVLVLVCPNESIMLLNVQLTHLGDTKVEKQMMLSDHELRPLLNHSNQKAALDYMVSLASTDFIPTYDGNMAKLVEGHRRYKNFQRSIILDRKTLVELLDLYQDELISWDQFSKAVRDAHVNRQGQQKKRGVIQGQPKVEDYFYANPQECF